MFIFCSFFFKLFQKFSDFLNPEDFIGKRTSKTIRLYPIFNKKKGLFVMKKIINSINYIYVYYILTRSSERIFNPSRYTGNI